MKRILFFFLMAYSIFGVSKEVTPPSGEAVFETLFSMNSLELQNEPLCNLTSIKSDAPMTLGQHLATVLSVSHITDTSTQLSSSCSPSKYQTAGGTPKDIWDCMIQVVEKRQDDEMFISSSTIAFSLTTQEHLYVKGSLRCL